MHFITILAAFQGVLALVQLALLAIKPFRNWFLGIKERREQNECREATEHESVKCLLRSEIVRIYYGFRDRSELHSFEYENVAMLYSAYKQMGGNSFVDRIWDELQGWEIIP